MLVFMPALPTKPVHLYYGRVEIPWDLEGEEMVRIDFVWPAMTCGLFVLKWRLPVATSCCPSTSGNYCRTGACKRFWRQDPTSLQGEVSLLGSSGSFIGYAWIHQCCQITRLLTSTTLGISSLMGTLPHQARLSKLGVVLGFSSGPGSGSAASALHSPPTLF